MNARDLLANATPRPWHQDGGTWRTPNGYAQGLTNWVHDSSLIVTAVNDYEALLDLRDAVQEYARVNDLIRADAHWKPAPDAGTYNPSDAKAHARGAARHALLARLDAARSGA